MQHTAAMRSAVMCRITRPLALKGLVCVVVAAVLAPISAQTQDLDRNSTETPTSQTDSTTESSNSGHILFKAARRKHAKKKKHSKTQANDVNAANAIEAAEVAGQAAQIAHRVANHAEKIESHAADALAYAKDALRGAAVHAGGVDKGALEDAVSRVEKAGDDAADAGRYSRTGTSTSSDVTVTKTGDVDKLDRQLKRLQNELDGGQGAGASDDAQMEAELRKLQQKLDAMKKAQASQPGGVNAATETLQEKLRDLERQMKASEVAKAAGLEPPPGTASQDELKVKLEETREQLGKLSGSQPSADSQQKLQELQDKLDKLRQLRAKEAQLKSDPDNEALKAEIEQLRKELGAGTTPGEAERRLAYQIDQLEQEINATPGAGKGIDIDAALPYGDAEPFGRESTAHDLTTSSKHESDAMVDQIERAETMEERRAVFRALTRLRGATITAYDGIAKSHLNNVIQYNKEHKWRDAHPMKHLAQEEDDVAKWAFPNNSEEVPPAAAGSSGPATAPAPAAPAPAA